MNGRIIYEYLTAAEKSDTAAQLKLCQFLYNEESRASNMPEIFWERIDKLAQKGKDFANFILHCRYFSDPSQSQQAYHYIRKAIRHKTVPLAFLRLGICYNQGIGTTENHTLASYFFYQAYIMGVKEAGSFIDMDYDSGRRNFVKDFNNTLTYSKEEAPALLKVYQRQAERERINKNYGILSQFRDYIPSFYPDYNQKQGFDDFLNSRETVDADICYSLSTTNNYEEVDLDLIDRLLQQLYAPITQNQQLISDLASMEDRYLALHIYEKEFLQSNFDLIYAFKKICQRYPANKIAIIETDISNIIPYVKMSTITLFRKQAFRCLLAIKDLDPVIEDEFLANLGDDNQLLDIASMFCNADPDIASLLIAFISLNIDIRNLMIYIYQPLLKSYQKQQFDFLVSHLNQYVQSITDMDIEHDLPEFTKENLPEITL